MGTRVQAILNPLFLYRYVVSNPINAVDPLGLSTFSLGLTVNIQLGPININGFAGLAIDGNGGLGSYWGYGGGGGAGAKISGGVNFASSNSACIQDLEGPFGNTSASFGGGLNGSVDGFSGQGSQGQTVTGGGFTAGFGVGGGWSVGGSQTYVQPIW